MKIYSMTPIHAGEAEVARRQSRYDLLTQDLGVRVVLNDLDDRPEVPRGFDTAAQIAASDPVVIAKGRELVDEGVQLIMPDCILDPGREDIAAAGGDAFGILQLTVAMLTAIGKPYGAVARNQPIADALDARIRGYDSSSAFLGVAVLGLSVEHVASPEHWNRAVVQCAADFAEQGACAVINGCSAVAVDAQTSIPVIDPTSLAVNVLDVFARFGLIGAQSR